MHRQVDLHRTDGRLLLTPEEALAGATRHAATALDLQDTHGTLEQGKRADFVVWDVGHPRELAYRFGHSPVLRVVAGGQEVSR